VIEPESLQQVDRTYVRWRRRKLSYFSGCDYFRLSSHPKIQRALVDGLKENGLSVAASRLTTGNHAQYLELENQLARFFKAETAVLLPSGYVANLAVAQALAGQFSHALIDKQSHPSLEDSARLLDCPTLRFSHRSVAGLEAAVQRCGDGCKPILLTDGLFSRDGAVAPLKEYLAALPVDAAVLVDDAHGAGVLGANGRGTLELTGVNRSRVIQTVTLSKAFGIYGGAVLSSSLIKRRILSRSYLYIGSTPLPLPLVNAALQSLAILTADKSLRLRLVRQTGYVRSVLSAAGVIVPETPGPIIGFAPKTLKAVRLLKDALLRTAIYPPFIHYPGGLSSGYFRFVISSEHSREQLDNLATVLVNNSHLIKPVV
jgi:7-keto-8-aminopelargonate synthetase-like enzyme